MLLSDLINQYSTTQDHDLRYMALREHVLNFNEPWDEQELRELVSRVLIPALGDQDRAIAELVSTQIFPFVARMHPLEAESCLVLPLCRKLCDLVTHMQDGPQVLQSLKNVLSELKTKLQTPEPLQMYCESMFSMPERPYMAWEALASLLQESSTYHMIQDLYPKLYRLALDDGRSAAINAVRIATAKTSPKIVRSVFQENALLTDAHLKLLSQITRVQAAFRFIYLDIIDKLLCETFTESVCSTLVNLSVWLLEPAIGTDSNMKSKTSAKLFERCREVLLGTAESKEMVSDEEEDPDQDAYLRELSDEDAEKEIEFEVEDDVASADQLCLELLRNVLLPIPEAIIDTLTLPCFDGEMLFSLIRDGRVDSRYAARKLPHDVDESIIQFMPLEYLNMLPKTSLIDRRIEFLSGASLLHPSSNLSDVAEILKEECHINEATKLELIELLKKGLDPGVANLSDLELAVDAVSALLKLRDLQDLQDVVAQLLWPHLKPNKMFIRTIKVGNMKQSIDDGISFRLNCYTLLQQLELSYKFKCLTLQECVERGFKDEFTIKEASTELFNYIFERTWPEIRIRDASWFLEKLCPRVQDRVDKALAAKPNGTATSQQIAHWLRSIACLESTGLMLSDTYRVITNDLLDEYP
ncbi:LANO_0G15676g1_1 [Lachancea nothofagi CBS 11611]|uniref:LANO_0G15676g1_1 n=1 Tax=Lachancea nothofagi CBS 11611 TaxID=1266666 RepID=A0A1G4KKF3_9SACH|nr:LANO_0G15676g1_1 [Lachancea nothofagi CBS 11611]